MKIQRRLNAELNHESIDIIKKDDKYYRYSLLESRLPEIISKSEIPCILTIDSTGKTCNVFIAIPSASEEDKFEARVHARKVIYGESITFDCYELGHENYNHSTNIVMSSAYALSKMLDSERGRNFLGQIKLAYESPEGAKLPPLSELQRKLIIIQDDFKGHSCVEQPFTVPTSRQYELLSPVLYPVEDHLTFIVPPPFVKHGDLLFDILKEYTNENDGGVSYTSDRKRHIYSLQVPTSDRGKLLEFLETFIRVQELPTTAE